MGLRDIARSLKPGNDRELAAGLSAQRRRDHRRSIPAVAAEAEEWEQADRARDRRDGWRHTNWDD